MSLPFQPFSTGGPSRSSALMQDYPSFTAKGCDFFTGKASLYL